MDRDRYEALRQNVLDAPSNYVPNQQADALALVELLDARRQQTADLPQIVPGVAWAVVNGLRLGIRNAPPGVIVYHERLQLLQLFEAIDLLTEAVEAIDLSPGETPPAPQPAADDAN